MSVAQELVLVFPTRVLHDIGHFDGFSTEVDRYLPAVLGCGELAYRPRGQMEEDPSFKQLIPYCLFRHTDEHGVVRLFNYRRGGGSGEERLRAKRSVGVGGHISTLDGDASRDDPPQQVYRRGLERELAEEVSVDSPSHESCVGLINDEATPVGRVHLGVVHVFDLQAPAVTPREEDIQDTGFTPLEVIASDLACYESWSQIAVRGISGVGLPASD